METNEDVKRSLIQAVILAGGKGTRLAERLGGRPKPLIDVDGVPLLERQILFLKRRGIEDVVILVNHGADQIASYCAARDNFGITLTQIDDGEPRGTAGAVLACLDRLADRFLVVYGDTLFNIDIDRLLAAHVRTGAVATLFLHPNDHPFNSDLVDANSFNAMTQDLKISHEELKMYNLELEDKVAKRTTELSQINKEIKDILDNMSQAIFTIDRDFKFNAQHSRFAVDIFGNVAFARQEVA